MAKAFEINFDGLIGPTHNYAGLSLGNLASARNAGAVSNPRAAALQGLQKMRALKDMGLRQGFIPPQDRPDLNTLRALGYTGDNARVLESAAKDRPDLLANVYSASCMWTANAGTVSPSADTSDGKVHFTPANLAGNFHRSLEPPTTARILKAMFPEGDVFAHHEPLPGGVHVGDEGAANHGRFAKSHGEPGVELFVYGEAGDRFPARQAQLASEAVARLHKLDPARTVFVKQSKKALDAGAFHNDVVGVANETVLFLHEESFEDRDGAYAAIRAAAPFVDIVEAPAAEVSLEDAVSSYLFNSQLITRPDGTMVLILPLESQENPRVKAFVDSVLDAGNSIADASYYDVRESMRNGGGPACLRLRVALTEAEAKAVNPNFLLDDDQFDVLESWVKSHYRDRLHPDDFSDATFMNEALTALDALTEILSLGAFYDFQK